MASAVRAEQKAELTVDRQELACQALAPEQNGQRLLSAQSVGNLLVQKPTVLPSVTSAQVFSAAFQGQATMQGKKTLQPKLIAVPLKAFAGSLSLSNVGIPGSQATGHMTTEMKAGQPVISLILNSSVKGSHLQIGNQQAVPIFLASSTFSNGTVLQPVRLGSLKTGIPKVGDEKLKPKAKKGERKVNKGQGKVLKQDDGDITVLKEIPAAKKSAVFVKNLTTAPQQPAPSKIEVAKVVLPAHLLALQNCQTETSPSLLCVSNRQKLPKSDNQTLGPVIPPGIKVERVKSDINTSVVQCGFEAGVKCTKQKPSHAEQMPANHKVNPVNKSAMTSELATMTLKAFARSAALQSPAKTCIDQQGLQLSKSQDLHFVTAPNRLVFPTNEAMSCEGADVVDSPRCASVPEAFAKKSQPKYPVVQEVGKKPRKPSRLKKEKKHFVEQWRDPALEEYKKLVQEVSPLARLIEKKQKLRQKNSQVLPKGPLASSDSEDEDLPKPLLQRLDVEHCPSQTGSSRKRGVRLARELEVCSRQSLVCLKSKDPASALDLVAAIRQEPLETMKTFLCPGKPGRTVRSNRAKCRLYGKKMCQFLSEEDTPACDAPALPCSNLCASHILQSDAQVLFEPCIGVDGISCGVPAVPGLCEVPLCSDHFASVGKSLSRRVPRHKWKKRGRPSAVNPVKDPKLNQRGKKSKISVLESKRQTKSAKSSGKNGGRPSLLTKNIVEREQTPSSSQDLIEEEMMDVESVRNLSDLEVDDDDLVDAFPAEAFRGMFGSGVLEDDNFDDALDELADYNVPSDLFDLLSDSAFADAMLSRGIETMGDDLNESDFQLWDTVPACDISRGFSEHLLTIHSPVPGASPTDVNGFVTESTLS